MFTLQGQGIGARGAMCKVSAVGSWPSLSDSNLCLTRETDGYPTLGPTRNAPAPSVRLRVGGWPATFSLPARPPTGADGREPLLTHGGARPACVRGLLLGSVLPGSAEEAHGVGSKSAERLHRERLNGLKACGRDGWVARALTGLGKTKRGPFLNSCLANVLVRAGVPNGDVRIALS